MKKEQGTSGVGNGEARGERKIAGGNATQTTAPMDEEAEGGKEGKEVGNILN